MALVRIYEPCLAALWALPACAGLLGLCVSMFGRAVGPFFSPLSGLSRPCPQVCVSCLGAPFSLSPPPVNATVAQRVKSDMFLRFSHDIYSSLFHMWPGIGHHKICFAHYIHAAPKQLEAKGVRITNIGIQGIDATKSC